MPAITFEIRHIDTETLKAAAERGQPIPKSEWALYETHDDGANAANAVQRHKDRYGHYTWTIVRNDPTAGDADWRSREINRFINGTYKKLEGRFPLEYVAPYSDVIGENSYLINWAGRTIHDKLIETNPESFIHIAQNDARKVAYTQNNDKGRKDIQTTLSGTEFTRKVLCWPEPMQDLFIEAVGGYNVKLLYATTGDDMEAIYRECDSSREVGSCMTYSTDSYDTGGIHPVQVYAAGDLQVAYVREEGEIGKIWGRCLVWPERKTWGRIYSTNAALMRKALRAAGYTDGEGESSLKGAKLKLIWIDEHAGKIVCPYIDYTQSVDWNEGSESLTIGGRGGEYEAARTSGTATLGDRHTWHCEYCEEGQTDNSSCYEVEGSNYCESCCDRHVLRCENCCENFTTDNMHRHEGDYYCHDCFGEHFTECMDCCDTIQSDEAHYHEATSRTLCHDCNSTRETEEEAVDAIIPEAFQSRTGFDLEQYVGLSADQISLELSADLRYAGRPVTRVERSNSRYYDYPTYHIHFTHTSGLADSYQDLPRDAKRPSSGTVYVTGRQLPPAPAFIRLRDFADMEAAQW